MSAVRRPAGRPRALVTGGAGFVGSHLVDRLLAEGADVLVVDDLSTGSASRLAPTARLEEADITTADLIGLARSWRPERVFHLAAQASVARSQADPGRDLEVNVVGTHRVAAAARDGGAERLVFVSSGGAVYGETTRPATERTLPAPTSYYGVHKLAAEGHVRIAGIPAAIVRPSNIYGRRQAAGLEGAVVAAFITQAFEGRLAIHGDGLQTRDFVHVDDVVAAIWLLGRDDGRAGTWNVASGRSTTILQLAELVERASGTRLERTFSPRRAGDVTSSAISAARLRELGWRPATTLAGGIDELVRTSKPGPDHVPAESSPGRPRDGRVTSGA